MDRRDVELARILHNDPSVIRHLSDPTIINEEQQKKWFERLCNSSTSQRYVVYEKDGFEDSNSFVGVFRIDSIDHHNKSVMVGMDVMPNKRKNGYAFETYTHFLHHFFHNENMNRVYLYVLETNSNASSLYKKLGFVEEGRQRQAIYRDGHYVDYVMMSILRCEFNHD
jgi:RimJ/RimL family protein N-acetyltransferase